MSKKFQIRFRITITEIYTGKEKTHEGDMVAVLNFLDDNSNFELTISEINRLFEGDIFQINDYQTAKIERILQ